MFHYVLMWQAKNPTTGLVTVHAVQFKNPASAEAMRKVIFQTRKSVQILKI